MEPTLPYEQGTEIMAEGARKTGIMQVVADYGRRLAAFIRKRVATDEDAEDVLQDVWYQLSNLPALDAIESISGWLFRVARNRLTDRQRKRRETLLDDLAFEDEDGESTQFAELLAAIEADEDAPELKRLFWQQFMDALDELPEAQRSVFIQNEIEEKTFAEISAATGENIKTLISRKGYAVKHLRRRLQDLYTEFIQPD
jgi:RNA polymerase sigma factor (sigma-70 family)